MQDQFELRSEFCFPQTRWRRDKILHYLSKLKIRGKTILKNIRIFAFRNSPISRNRWDRNAMSIWQSSLHGSVCAPRCRFATAVPVGFMFYRKKLWLVWTGTTDNNSMARKVKTGIENCTVYYDHILNAEWLSYQIQDTLYGLCRPLQIMLFFLTIMLMPNAQISLKCFWII